MSWLFGRGLQGVLDHPAPGSGETRGVEDVVPGVAVEMPSEDPTVIRVETVETLEQSNSWLPSLPALPPLSGPTSVLPSFLRSAEAGSEAAGETEAEHSDVAPQHAGLDEQNLDGQGEQCGASSEVQRVPELTPLPTPRDWPRGKPTVFRASCVPFQLRLLTLLYFLGCSGRHGELPPAR